MIEWKATPRSTPQKRSRGTASERENDGLDQHRGDGDELADESGLGATSANTVEPDELAEQVAATGGFRGEVGGVQLVEHREQIDHQQHETDRAARGIQPALDKTVRQVPRPVPDGRGPQGRGSRGRRRSAGSASDGSTPQAGSAPPPWRPPPRPERPRPPSREKRRAGRPASNAGATARGWLSE